MEDFIFGTLITDDLKLVYHRAARRGIQHAHVIAPLDPAPGQPVTLTARVGPDLDVQHIACYYTLDGSPPAGGRGEPLGSTQVARFEQVEVMWDSMVWGYVDRWQVVLPPQPEGTVVRYRVGGWSESGGEEVFADWPNARAQVEEATAAHFSKRPVRPVEPGPVSPGDQFVYHVDRFSPPQWAREAVFYHLLVDRFYPGNGRKWLEPEDLRGFYGGTLWGVRDKLGYIADLGATCIWLSPIWPSPTHHGYDVTNNDHVAPRLGGDEALEELVEAAHARGLRVVLDLVCNHISALHPYFQAASADMYSEYRDWFLFDDSDLGYKAYFGVASMPEINLANPATRQWMIRRGRVLAGRVRRGRLPAGPRQRPRPRLLVRLPRGVPVRQAGLLLLRRGRRSAQHAACLRRQAGRSARLQLLRHGAAYLRLPDVDRRALRALHPAPPPPTSITTTS